MGTVGGGGERDRERGRERGHEVGLGSRTRMCAMGVTPTPREEGGAGGLLKNSAFGSSVRYRKQVEGGAGVRNLIQIPTPQI